LDFRRWRTMRSLAVLGRYAALLLYGISTFTLQPNSDYAKHVSSAEDMARKSWERTGQMILSAIDRHEVTYGKKQAKTDAKG